MEAILDDLKMCLQKKENEIKELQKKCKVINQNLEDYVTQFAESSVCSNPQILM